MVEDNLKSIELDVDDLRKFKLRYSLGQDDGRNSRHFLRIKVTEGAITSRQLVEVSRLSDQYGRGKAWVTDRQSIQLHWIEGKHATDIFSRLEGIGFTTDKCGQAYPKPGYGDLRNVCTCPVAGFEKGEQINVKPLAEEINEFFVGNEDFLDMPKKFKISISACDIDCARSQMQDLGFFYLEKDGEPGFGAVIGGAMGIAKPGAVTGKPLNVFIKPEDVFEVSKKMAEIHRDYSNTEEVAKARFKWLVHEWGAEKVRDKLEDKLGRKLERHEYSGPKISGREHVGIQEQENGKYFVNIPLIGGGISSEALREISKVSEKYGTGDIRTTPYQNLILLNISPDELETSLETLKDAGLSVKGSRTRWESVACAADFCANSSQYRPKRALRSIIDYLEENIGDELSDFKVNIGISGCPRDCGLLKASDIGMLAVSPGENGIDSEKYMPHLGGEFGEDARFADRLPDSKSVGELKGSIQNLIEETLDEGYNNIRDLYADRTTQELIEIAEMGEG